MKRFITCLCIVLLSSFFFQAKSQIQIGVYGSASIHAKPYDNYKSKIGFGLQSRYFLNPHFAVGVSVDRLTQTFRVQTLDNNHQVVIESKGKTQLTPVTVTGEYFFTTQGVRPYVGIKTGVYLTKGSGSYRDTATETSSSFKNSYFGLAPKVGFQMPLSSKFAVFLEGEYDYVFPKRAGIARKYFQANFGIVYHIITP
ncbi:OmpW family outer membrane protein [Siphonobacter sp.]|uniref:OmpW family outer membrane protein n=1 Tax=Siphonobacter sp. TaxID=1869184 RepID=UPI003B3AB5E3